MHIEYLAVRILVQNLLDGNVEWRLFLAKGMPLHGAARIHGTAHAACSGHTPAACKRNDDSVCAEPHAAPRRPACGDVMVAEVFRRTVAAPEGGRDTIPMT